jgi:hypothetical protein
MPRSMRSVDVLELAALLLAESGKEIGLAGVGLVGAGGLVPAKDSPASSQQGLARSGGQTLVCHL